MFCNRYLDRLHSHFAKGDEIFCRLISHSDEKVLTWADFGVACGSYAAAYRAAELKKGDVVLIFLKHVSDLYGSFFGAMFAGVVPSFMPTVSPRQDPGIYWRAHAELLERVKPAAIVAARETIEEMQDCGLCLDQISLIITQDVSSEPLQIIIHEENAVGLLQHSSGTTGLKKGVALSFKSIIRQAESYSIVLNTSNNDRIVHWLPLYHDMGLIACAVIPAYLGISTVHIDPLTWVSRPDILFDSVTRYGGTLTWMPNFAFEHMANVCAAKAEQYNLSSMRAFINCSEPCKPRAFDRFVQAFSSAGVSLERLQCCYAMAETVFAVSQTALGTLPKRLRVDPTSLKRGCAIQQVLEGGIEILETGASIDGINIAIINDDNKEQREGIVGEIALSGCFLFSGYAQEPERTAKYLREGIYYTGDLGFLLEKRLFVLGRTDDLIIVNGRNIYAHQVEAALSNVEGLKPGRSVATALYDARIGSEVLLIISERMRATDRSDFALRDDIIRIVQSTFNVMPQKVRIVDEGWLIKTTSGKISRTENLNKLMSEFRSGTVDQK